VREASSPKAGRIFAAAVAGWSFRPFTIGEQPMPVCAMTRLVFPPERSSAKEVLPYPLPERPTELTIVPSQTLTRISGQKNIVPDDFTKAQIGKRRIRLIGAFQYCIDETGHVDEVVLIRSTGAGSYDQAIERAMHAWIYEPYFDEGKPVPVCSSVNFIYSQR
jgi:hypothetical protein